jgi:hypothetical protein
LHRRGIEIVSPTFMNQRRIDDRPPFIPRVVEPAGEVDEGSPIPEDKIFDKAEMAQAIEELREEKRELEQGLEDLKAEHDTAAEARQPLLTMRMEYTKNRLEAIKRLFDEHNNSD